VTSSEVVAIDLQAAFRLDGRVAIVTGASGGLGNRFARVLHAAGATVIVGARRTGCLEQLRDELGPRVVPVTCDLRETADHVRLVDEALRVHGHIDVLVNNAGVATITPAESEQLEVFRDTIEVNVSAAFHLSQLAGRCMLERGRGSIVQVASILGIVASAPVNQASYCASKSALIGLTRELGCQWARRGVRVNALAPGGFASQMNALSSADEDDPLLAFVRTNCPMGRYGEPHELDGAILFLAADASSYMTGQTLVIDGGWVAR
jgi:hypothetical protein